MAFLPSLLQFAGNLARGKHARAFEQAARDPEAAQRAVLARILERNAGTAYARAHFPQARAAEEYAQRAPLISPAELQPWVKREMAGERNLLTADPPVYYVRTTGSTGEPKHIPITESYRDEFQRTVHVSLWHLRRRFPEAFRGRALYFVGSRKVARAADGNDVGTMSGFNFTEMPKLVRAIYAWPYELFEVADLSARGFLALLFATIGEPSIIAGIFPAPIVYLLRDLESQLSGLARCLRDGKLPALALTAAQRELFQRKLGGPRPRLARRLDAAAKLPVGEQVAAAWPRLRLIYCWTTATAGLYLPELQRRVGSSIAVRDAIYSACEGWCSIPMGEERPGGALALLSHFFEFIDESGALRFAWQLEDGKRYAIVLTTSAGLYRYALGDIIEVCGFHEKAPRIRFVRKEGAASNLAGEKLDESHVNRAVGDALAKTGLTATFFTLAPRLSGDRPGYTLYLEPEFDADLEPLRAEVDRALGEASFDYGRLRAGGQLAALALQRIPRGTYARIRQSKVRDGSAEAQLKTAHLVSEVAALPPELR